MSASSNITHEVPKSTTVRAYAPQAGENAVIWTLWLTYGAFYFCRTNISAAVPGLKASIGSGGLGLSAAEVGWILASLKIAYGLGQFLNGQLSERISPRVMLALGMFGSAALNVLFGLGTGFYFLLFVWASNGFFQSLGWTPCVRVAANWIPIIRRGHAIGVIGTGYQITLGLTFVVASWAATRFGWQGAHYVPAVLLALTGLFMLVCLQETPMEKATIVDDEVSPPSLPAQQLRFSESLYWTLYNPTLWLLGLSLGLLNACRYGYIDWGLTHLVERRPDLPLNKAGLQYFVIAIGATAGAYLAGWATDRFFGSRRGPVICVLMAVLALLSVVYDAIVVHSPVGTLIVLVVIGFCIYGPQVLLVGTAPADLAHRGASAAAAGFVNFMGYMGAATGDVVTGYFSSPEHGGWKMVFNILAAWALAGTLVTGILWNTTARRIGLLPTIAPKIGALAAIALASIAIGWSDQPLLLQVATYLAGVCLLGAFFSRWAALPPLTIAATGLLMVFASYVRMSDGVTWQQATGMVAYGLTAITSLMILVEIQSEQ
jgi:sugar phosphate permease